MTLIPSAGEALEAWAAAVRANREQAERVREPSPEGANDFYAPVARVFRADPRRTDEPALDHLLSLGEGGETWLDIGAGGGRYALPLALKVGQVIAVEPSEGMREQLQMGMAEAGIANVRVVEGRWPAAEPAKADVALIAHVGYDIEDIGPFLDAMEASARRLCVAVLLASSPASVAAPYFETIHGEPRNLLPALPQFLALLLARRRLFEVWLGERGGIGYPTREGALTALRLQLFLTPGSEKDRRLQKLVDELPEEGGVVRLARNSEPLGIVSWRPEGR